MGGWMVGGEDGGGGRERERRRVGSSKSEVHDGGVPSSCEARGEYECTTVQQFTLHYATLQFMYLTLLSYIYY